MATSKKRIRDEGLRLAVAAAGSRYRLAKALKLALPTLTRWHRIPSHHVIKIERLFSIDRERLRPDLHPPRSNDDVTR
jgi:DNA-binding transcriptional regulator YdaS (Cro superfamily)